LDESALTLFARFQGLNLIVLNIRFHHDSLGSLPLYRSPEIWERLFRQHPQSHTLEYFQCIARILLHAPAMRHLHLSVKRSGGDPLNSLTTLLQSCRGTLHLDLQYLEYDDVKALCDLEGYPHLEDSEIRELNALLHGDLHHRVRNALLVGLGANQTMQVFRFTYSHALTPELSMRVVQMLPGNTSLRKFDGFN